MMRLADIRFSTRGRVVIARLVGELDMSNAADVGETLAEGTPNEMLALVLDLSELDYLDSAGIQLLYRLRGNLRIRGQKLQIVIPATSTAHDALRLAGVSTFLDVVDGVEQALVALRRDCSDDEVPSPDSA